MSTKNTSSATPVDPLVIRHSDTVEELIKCADAWEDDARLLGNVRAADMSAALREALRIVRELGGYSHSLWDDENFRDGYRKVNSGLIVDASKFQGGKDG